MTRNQQDTFDSLINQTFNALRPKFIGLDSVFDTFIDHGMQKNSNYPPTNIIKIKEHEFLIEIAVAGFQTEDIKIHLHNDILTVSGMLPGKPYPEGSEVIQNNIAGRKFHLSYKLAPHFEVESADLNSGILSITLKQEIPEEAKPKRIEINKG